MGGNRKLAFAAVELMMARDNSTTDARWFRRERPPVLLLGRLNMMRALGMASIGSVVASSEPDSYAFASRFRAGKVVLPAWGEPPDQVVETLVRAGKTLSERAGCRIPIFYGSDDPLRLLYLYREQLSPHYLFLLSDTPLGLAMLDKQRFAALSASLDLPVPRTLSTDGSAGHELAQGDYPVIVKPRKKTDWHASRIYREIFAGKGKARVMARGRDLVADPVLAPLLQDLVVQEYIPGGDDRILSFHGFADETSVNPGDVFVIETPGGGGYGRA